MIAFGPERRWSTARAHADRRKASAAGRVCAAFASGARARREGRGIGDNPHASGTLDHRYWLAGWMDANTGENA